MMLVGGDAWRLPLIPVGNIKKNGHYLGTISPANKDSGHRADSVAKEPAQKAHVCNPFSGCHCVQLMVGTQSTLVR